MQLQDSKVAKEREIESFKKSHADVSSSHATAAAALAQNEELLQSLLTGLSSSNTNSNTSGGGYMGQLSAAKANLSRLSAEEEQLKNRLGMVKKEIATKEGEWKKVEAEARKVRSELKKEEKELEGLKKKLEGCKWNEEREKSWKSRKDELGRDISAGREVCLCSLRYFSKLMHHRNSKRFSHILHSPPSPLNTPPHPF
jgi:structural maintenance of chromosome 2